MGLKGFLAVDNYFNKIAKQKRDTDYTDKTIARRHARYLLKKPVFPFIWEAVRTKEDGTVVCIILVCLSVRSLVSNVNSDSGANSGSVCLRSHCGGARSAPPSSSGLTRVAGGRRWVVLGSTVDGHCIRHCRREYCPCDLFPLSSSLLSIKRLSEV